MERCPVDFGSQVALDEQGFPLGVSWELIQRFVSKGSEEPDDNRVGLPLIAVAAQRDMFSNAFAEANVSPPSKTTGLAREAEWTEALNGVALAALKALAQAISCFPVPVGTESDDTAAWTRALVRPLTTTADVCFFILKPDCAEAAAGGPTASFVELVRDRGVGYDRRRSGLVGWDRRRDDQGRLFVGRATHFLSHAWSYPFRTLAAAVSSFWDTRDRAHDLHPYFWLDIACIDQVSE